MDKETGQLSWFHKVRSWCDKSQLAALQTCVHAGAEETVDATAGIRTNCGDVTHMQFFGRSENVDNRKVKAMWEAKRSSDGTYFRISHRPHIRRYIRHSNASRRPV